ncbi:MAG: YceI family protein [Bacteriovoracaceae bacterium]|nr:YceI family protein [Bacteriovoracaceae bacterium]
MPIILFILSISLSHATTWRSNKNHSELLFKVPYLTISHVTGRFSRFESEFEIRDQLKSVILRIDANSIDTNNDQRDGHLKSQDFLFAKKYPQIIFQSQSIQSLGNNKYLALGTLKIRDTEKKLSLPFEMSPSVIDSWNYESRFTKFNTTLNRKDFKLLWNKTLADNQFLVGDEITIEGRIQFQLSSSPTPTSKHMIPDTPSIREREKLNRGELVSSRPNLSSTSVPYVKAKEIPKQEPLIKITSVDGRERLVWQIWFWVLGLLGFFAALILGFFGKKLCMDYFKEKYEETGPIGNLSDIITIGFTLIYAMAFWYVGWG